MAIRAFGKIRGQQTVFFIDHRMPTIGWPDLVGASFQTLQVMNGAVAFVDALRVKPGFLELAIHIAGEHKTALGQSLSNPPQYLKTRVRNGGAVEVQAMPVEAPGQTRLGFECRRAGDMFERNPRPAQCRISAPESLRTTKIRQTGIDAHAGTRSNQQSVGLVDEFSAIHVIERQSALTGWSKKMQSIKQESVKTVRDSAAHFELSGQTATHSPKQAPFFSLQIRRKSGLSQDCAYRDEAGRRSVRCHERGYRAGRRRTALLPLTILLGYCCSL